MGAICGEPDKAGATNIKLEPKAANPYQPTEEEMNHFREFVEKKEAPWCATPPEAREKMNNVDKVRIGAVYAKIWTDADANGDGGLNEEEWVNYNKMLLVASEENYGFTLEYDDEYAEMVRIGYKALTSWTPHETGVTKEAMIPYTKCAYTHRRELEAAGKWLK